MTDMSLVLVRGAMRVLSRTAPSVASRVAVDLFMKARISTIAALQEQHAVSKS